MIWRRFEACEHAHNLIGAWNRGFFFYWRKCLNNSCYAVSCLQLHICQMCWSNHMHHTTTTQILDDLFVTFWMIWWKPQGVSGLLGNSWPQPMELCKMGTKRSISSVSKVILMNANSSLWEDCDCCTHTKGYMWLLHAQKGIWLLGCLLKWLFVAPSL